MRCLGIPIDHRLRGLSQTTNEQKPMQETASEHIRILSKFGHSLSRHENGDCLPAHELDFGLELARPECTGGLVIVLDHPSPSQTYTPGYVAEEARCKTLAAIKDLVSNATSGLMDTDAITILDSMPFITEYYNGSPLHVEAQHTFLRALEAKRPDVVLSCFRTKTNINLLKRLQGQGIGKDNDPVRLTFPGSGHEFQRISAFHPSYAVNRKSFDAKFRRLLMLHFYQAVAVCWGTWEHRPWMAQLRVDCAKQVLLYKASPSTLCDKLATLVNALHDFEASLKAAQYSRHDRSTQAYNVPTMIHHSELSSRACEISLLLRDGSVQKILGGRLSDVVRIILHNSLHCLDIKSLDTNFDVGTVGYCDHLQLVN
ncbi:uncharacterized protein RHO25_003915 [Cercospora beticola]|uniref:Uncharacterized protein n=1 Tax=Cercospora beticola TaxID=122368 RepID=A0ABZ0NIG9_CERBT|nr:hypothetical protein RHO25_003915 [Cercospora beticola]